VGRLSKQSPPGTFGFLPVLPRNEIYDQSLTSLPRVEAPWSSTFTPAAHGDLLVVSGSCPFFGEKDLGVIVNELELPCGT